jgi:hypothetical protein
MVNRKAGQRPHGRDRERRAADLVRGVDLPRAVARDVDAEVTRNREVREPVLVGIRSQEEERVGAPVVAASGRLSSVGPDHQDYRRLGEERSVQVG